MKNTKNNENIKMQRRTRKTTYDNVEWMKDNVGQH